MDLGHLGDKAHASVRQLPSPMASPASKSAALLILCLAWLTASSAYSQGAPPSAERNGIGDGALPALRHVGIAAPGGPDFALHAGLGYGHLESVVDDSDAHHLLGATLAGSYRPIDQFAIGLHLQGQYIRHTGGPSAGDTGGVTRSRISLRGDFDVVQRLRLGVEGRLALPATQRVGRSFRYVSPELLGLLTYIPLPHLLISAQLGFRYDNSGAAIRRPDGYSLSDRAVLGAGSGPALLSGLGLAYRHGLLDVIAEWSWDAYVGKDAPALRQTPMELTAGVRLWPSDALHVDLLVAVSPSARPNIALGRPLQVLPPRYWLGVSLGLRFGSAPPPPQAPPQPLVATSTAATPPPPAPGVIEGVVRGPDGSPVPDATIRYDGADGPAEVRSDAEGRFRIEDAPPGELSLQVQAEGFAPFALRVPVESGQTAAPEVMLEPPLPQGVIRGTVRDFHGKPVHARIHIEPGGLKAGTDDNGEFELEVAPGEYTVTVRARGYQTETRNAKVYENGVAVVLVDLREKR